ncbi:MAG: hypothetical protein WA152_03430 [Microgenomates group bacterium]
MHAFLLVNKDPIQFAEEQNAKVIPFTMQKIEDARNLKKIVKFKFNEKTAIIINDIDLATNETLNAFLKNLEEPNENLIYILTASNLNNVLPTIISRCEIIAVQSTEYLVQRQHRNYKDALNIKDRDEAIKFVEDLLFLDKEKKEYKNMENYLNTLKNLKLNGNVSLQMTNLVARMSSTTN